MSRGALVGREVELDALRRATARARVVTVTGAPGIGKTALVAALAEAVRATTCPLAGLEGSTATCREVARALGLSPPTGGDGEDVAARIGRALASRTKPLLVIDDADLARSALAKLLPRWLREAPSARFVVASRSRLALPSAQRFDLGPLEVPAAGVVTLDDVSRASAVRLFVRVASSARAGYRLSAVTAPHVATIVRALGGAPLAIELAAARVSTLGEVELAAAIADRIDAVDTRAARTGARSLRGAFALSWGQLDGGDARALASLSVFRGAFDLDAASAVIGAPKLATAEIIDRLEESSLLRAFEATDAPGALRYALHPVVRAFAAERRTEEDVLCSSRRHAEHYGRASTARAPVALDALERDREELDAALGWSIESGEIALAARLALAATPLVLARGPLTPFLSRVDALLSRRGLSPALACEIRLARALARIHRGRRDEALSDLTTARTSARRVKNARVGVLAASKAGLVLGLRGEPRAAQARFEQALALLARAPVDPWLAGVVAKDRANVLSEEGRNADAMAELSRARDLFHAAGDAREEGFVLMMLGSRLLDVGRLRDARRDCEAGAALLTAAGDRRAVAFCDVLLALVDGEEGDLRGARTRLDRSLRAFREVGDAHSEGLALGYLGNVALEQDALSEAEDRYRAARDALAQAGDRAAEGLVTAAAAVVDARLGRLGAARERLARARALTAKDARVVRRAAIEVLARAVEGGDAAGTVPDRSVDDAEELRFARRVVARGVRRRAGRSSHRARDVSLLVATDGSAFVAPSRALVTLPSRGALRGITRRLAEERLRYPGRAVSGVDLVRAGWPDEAILPSAAKNRLHVTIARLRRAGLEGVLLHDEDGYMLDPTVPARLVDRRELLPGAT